MKVTLTCVRTGKGERRDADSPWLDNLPMHSKQTVSGLSCGTCVAHCLRPPRCGPTAVPYRAGSLNTARRAYSRPLLVLERASRWCATSSVALYGTPVTRVRQRCGEGWNEGGLVYCVPALTCLHSRMRRPTQGIDLEAGGRNKKTAREAPKSENVYLALLVKVRCRPAAAWDGAGKLSQELG
eukprot:351532-Chlamydomonas_euryale.AAC.12